jgi:hypothetical protein
MTVTDIREWKQAKRRKELRKAETEIQPDWEAIARAEDRMNRLAAMLEAGAIVLDDCERLLEKWDREEGAIRPH